MCVDSIESDGPEELSYADEVYNGVPVRRLSYNLSKAPDPVRWEYDNVWIGDHLREYFCQEQPDIFHLYGGYLISGRSLFVASELSIPSLVSITDFWFLCRRFTMLRSNGTISTLPLDPVTCARCLGEEQRRFRLPGQIAPGLMQTFWQLRRDKVAEAVKRAEFLFAALDSADVLVTQSRFVGSMLVKAGIPSHRINFCRQGQENTEGPSPALEKTPTNSLRVGYIGQIAWHKGIHVLIEAAQKIPDANLTIDIYGDLSHAATYSTRLQSMIGKDTRITLKGAFQRQQIGRVFEDIDILAVPSLWYENSPNVIFEAFAHHTPVMATDLGGMAEIVQNEGNGLLFPLGDSDVLGQQLKRLSNNLSLLSKWANGIKPVRGMAEEMTELEAIYDSMLAKHCLQRFEPAMEQ